MKKIMIISALFISFVLCAQAYSDMAYNTVQEHSYSEFLLKVLEEAERFKGLGKLYLNQN